MTSPITDQPAEPTACPVEHCGETVDYIDLIPHLYSDHDGQELCEAIANLVADLAQEQAAHAKTVDNAEAAAELFETGQQNLRSRVDSVRTAAHGVRDERDRLRAQLNEVRAAALSEGIDAIHAHANQVEAAHSPDSADFVRGLRAACHVLRTHTPTAPTCSCAATPAHQHGCDADTEPTGFPPSLGPTRDTPEREQQLEALARKLNQPSGW